MMIGAALFLNLSTSLVGALVQGSLILTQESQQRIETQAIQPTQNLPQISQGLERDELQKTLSQVAEIELRIVDRLKSLRETAEKLPLEWKASGFRNLPAGTVLTKVGLLSEIEEMELTASERWSILIENLALLGKNESTLDLRSKRIRAELTAMPELHQKIHQKLDEFQARLKDGLLLDMASRVVDHL